MTVAMPEETMSPSSPMHDFQISIYFGQQRRVWGLRLLCVGIKAAKVVLERLGR
jgi:hypothetical protein